MLAFKAAFVFVALSAMASLRIFQDTKDSSEKAGSHYGSRDVNDLMVDVSGKTEEGMPPAWGCRRRAGCKRKAAAAAAAAAAVDMLATSRLDDRDNAPWSKNGRIFRICHWVECRGTNVWETSYADVGTGAKQDLRVSRPRLNTGEYRLYYYGLNGEEPIYGTGLNYLPSGSFVVKERYSCSSRGSPPSGCALAKPDKFVCKWTDQGTGGRRDGSFWQAVAPAGYKCLSDVAIYGSNWDAPQAQWIKPGWVRTADEIDPNFRCVKDSMAKVRRGKYAGADAAWNLVWTDAGSGGKYDGAVWHEHRYLPGLRVGTGSGDTSSGPKYWLIGTR